MDVLCILHDVERDTYHAAFFEEKPLPGPPPDWRGTTIVRLKSTLEGALGHLDDLVAKILVPPENVWREPRSWDGVIGITWLITPWRVVTPKQ